MEARRAPVAPFGRRAVAATLEALWLGAIVLVPLIFGPPSEFFLFDVPKVALARIVAGAMVSLWAVEALLIVASVGPGALATSLLRARSWLRAWPPRWVFAAAGALLLVSFVSGLASPLPSVAFWGFEPGRDGYSLYSTAAWFIIFTTIVARLRTSRQWWRIVGALLLVTGVASSYAVFQHFGVDPLDPLHFTRERVGSTFGNPIFAGSALLQALPLITAVTLVWWAKGHRGRAFIGVVLTGLTLTALAVTLARGPWVGAAFGLAVFLGLTWLLSGGRAARRGATILGASLIITALVLALPTSTQSDASAEPRLAETLARVASIPSTAASGLTGRVNIWRSSLEITAARPWFPFEDRGPTALRHLLGYGPDSFLYVFPLREHPALRSSIELTKDAHDGLLQYLVEQGVLGFAIALSIVLLGIGTGLYAAVRRTSAMGVRLVLIAIVSAFCGRFVEQLVGVAQIGDVFIYWTLAALLATAPAAMSEERPTQSAPPSPASPGSIGAIAAVGVMAVVVVIAVGTLTWAHPVTHLRAAFDNSASLKAQRAGDLAEALQLAEKASAHVPSLTKYRVRLIDLLGVAQEKTRGDDALLTTRARLKIAQDGLDLNRLSLTLNLRAAEARVELMRLGVPESSAGAISAWQRVAELLPNHWQPLRSLGITLHEAGDPESALAAYERALAIVGEGPHSAELLYHRGRAQRDLGRADAAISSFELAAQRAGEGSDLAAKARAAASKLKD